jgi:hypothetical protein
VATIEAATAAPGGGEPRAPVLGRAARSVCAAAHRRSLLDVATSVVPYIALSALMYLAVDVSYLLVPALAI